MSWQRRRFVASRLVDSYVLEEAVALAALKLTGQPKVFEVCKRLAVGHRPLRTSGEEMLRDVHHRCRAIEVGSDLAQLVETLDVVLFDVLDALDHVCERCSVCRKGQLHLRAETSNFVE